MSPAHFVFPRRAVLLLGLLAVAHLSAAEAYKWSVQYLIDNSQAAFGRSQRVFPRHNRGLALSADGHFLYAAYHQSFNGSGEVRKIDLRIADYENATVAVLPNLRAKAISVDEEGRVYLACGATIEIYDADLRLNECTIQMQVCDGVAVTREAGSLVVYATERDAHTLKRFVLQTRGATITGAVPSGFNGDGQLAIPHAMSPRGVAVDPKGRIWIADVEADKIFRVDRSGANLTSAEIKSPMAIAFDGNRAFVTRNVAREISILDLNMRVIGTLTVPWEELELAPFGNNRTGALAEIAVVPNGNGFYVANEGGQTANQKSTYGRTDASSAVIDGKLYTDSFADDNEPILHATPIAATEAPENNP